MKSEMTRTRFKCGRILIILTRKGLCNYDAKPEATEELLCRKVDSICMTEERGGFTLGFGIASPGDAEPTAAAVTLAEGVGGRGVRVRVTMCRILWKESDVGSSVSERVGAAEKGYWELSLCLLVFEPRYLF